MPCWCERDSCPVCRLGEIKDHKCTRCKVEYCPKCHGIVTSGWSVGGVGPCVCPTQ